MIISENIKKYNRFETDQSTVVYILPEKPDWFAVNKAGDAVLQSLETTSTQPIPTEGNIVWQVKRQNFLNNVPKDSAPPYHGRAEHLQLSHLDECWLHITDHCNLRCTHCLFSCSPDKKATLQLSDITNTIDEFYALGSKIFYLTGGEPLVHKEIESIIDYILTKYKDTSLVVMTNGILIPNFIDFFKTLPKDRILFQVSADGTEETHDKTRGKGSFKALVKGLDALKELQTRNTLAMVAHADNLSQLKDIVDLAKDFNIRSVHFMWLLVTGSATPELFVEPDIIFPALIDAYQHAKIQGIEIDNIRNMEAQVFSPAGTKYDMSNTGWRSIAVGPDKMIYPTAAMIGTEELQCGAIENGIESVWKESTLLNDIRTTSVIDSKTHKDSPFRFITGGGDSDHSFFEGGTLEADDPYLPLYEKIVLWLITENAKKTTFSPYPQIQLKMGDRLLQCHSEGNGVSLTHSNCALTFSNTRTVVGEFYTQADDSQNEDIVNPVCYPEEEIAHIPDNSRIKSYGCGSPVLDANIQEDEVIVDLGSGAGVECFIASKKTGKNGKVYGIDMLAPMLEKANKALPQVVANLGYNNIEFKKGFLEEIPLADNEADLVTSNCVINLSEDKRQTLKEIFRILKHGGRLIISDVVTDTPSSASIQNDEKLQGECIAGAMVQTHLFAILESIGFTDITILKRFFYRQVENHTFYSLTYTAYKPSAEPSVEMIYPGPYAAVITDGGEVLVRGQKYKREKPFNTEKLSPQILILDDMGNAANIEVQNSCCSFTPVQETPPASSQKVAMTPLKNGKDCMVCGGTLDYLKTDEIRTCYYCSKDFSANAVCKNDHYVCDECHAQDALTFAKELLTHTQETDMIRLMNIVRSHPSFNLHGPEHHFAMPGVITTVYKNNGGNITNEDILKAIDRGTTVPGGTCAFWGGCGASLGAGIGFGVILDSNPLKPKQRQLVQQLVAEITTQLAHIKAARCCQRECWLTLLKISELSEKYLGIKLPAEGDIHCTQMLQNSECIKAACPFGGKR